MKKNKKRNTSPDYLKWAIPAGIIFLALIVYARAANNDFVVYDDDRYLVNNGDVHILSIKNIFKYFKTFYVGMYQPVTMIFYAVTLKLFGMKPSAFHVLNILFHLVNIFLTFRLIQLLTRKDGVAAFVALFFAIHPMHVESVAWVAELKDMTYSFFFLLSLIYYLRFSEEKTKINYYLISILLFICSMFSKSAGMPLPLILVCIDYYRSDLSFKTILQKIPFLAVSLSFGIITMFSQQGAVEGLTDSFSLFERPFLVCYALSFYIIRFFFPHSFSVLHPYPEIGVELPTEYFFAPLILLIIIVPYFLSGKFKKDYFLGMMFFLLMIGPIIQIVPVGQAIAAERYTYIPYTGLLLIPALYFYYLKENYFSVFRKIENSIYIIIALYVVVFSVQTFGRVNDWSKSDSLFTDIIKKYPNHYFGYYSRGNFRFVIKDKEGALADLNKAISIRPKLPDIYNSRATVLSNMNDNEGALEDLNMVLKLNPKFQIGYENRARLLSTMGKYEESIKDCTTLLEMVPEYAYMYYFRGNQWFNVNKPDKACADWQKALSMGYAEAEKQIAERCK